MLFFLISRRDGENNGFLAGVPLLPPPSRVVSRPNSLPLPFRTPATQARCTTKSSLTGGGRYERVDRMSLCFFSLPYTMGTMEHIKSLVLDGNPLRSLRRDVVMVMFTEGIKPFLKKRTLGDIPFRRRLQKLCSC